MIIEGTSSVAYTMTTPSRFGMTWRRMMRRAGTPIATAASTNSRFLMLSVCPRAIRAMSSQLMRPMPTKSISIERPNTTMKRISTNM